MSESKLQNLSEYVDRSGDADTPEELAKRVKPGHCTVCGNSPAKNLKGECPNEKCPSRFV